MVKPSHRITRDTKRLTCSICEQADQAKLRQKRDDYCGVPVNQHKMRNGHCAGFKTIKPKKIKKGD